MNSSDTLPMWTTEMLRAAIDLAKGRARTTQIQWYVSVHTRETETGGALFAIRVDSEPDDACEWVLRVTPFGQVHKERKPDDAGPSPSA